MDPVAKLGPLHLTDQSLRLSCRLICPRPGCVGSKDEVGVLRDKKAMVQKPRAHGVRRGGLTARYSY